MNGVRMGEGTFIVKERSQRMNGVKIGKQPLELWTGHKEVTHDVLCQDGRRDP